MKNVILIPNIDLGNGRNTSYHYSVKSWKAWADKNNVELFEWTEAFLPVEQFPIILQRDFVFQILDNNNVEYDQVLIIDADTIVHPDCPNFFELTEGKLAGVVNNGCYEWVTRSIREWGSGMFSDQPLVKCWDYLNTGFIIVNKSHRDFFDHLTNEYYPNNYQDLLLYRDKIKASIGQTVLNFKIQEYNIEVQKLPERFNLQDLFRKNLLHIPGHSWFSDELHFLETGWVYHFNAIPKNDRDVSYWMERTYKHLYSTNE